MRDRYSPWSRFAVLAVAVLALGLTLAACGSSGSSKSAGNSSSADIIIKDLAYTTKAVQTGSTVTVKNDDSVTHTVTSDDGKFGVSIDPGKTATFTAPGDTRSYKFHCNIHSQMHGTLLVQ
jgi:plastocyanin